MEKLSYKKIWDTLRKVDYSKVLEDKGDLDYLNWADAWVLLVGKYPEATYKFHEPTFYAKIDSNGLEHQTCEVSCSIYIGGLEREFHLAVMQNTLPMRAVINPTSREISDSRARCMVKVMGMFGLGLQLWEYKNRHANDSQRVSNNANGKTKMVELAEDLAGF